MKKILYYLLLILPLLWVRQINVLGENLLPLLMIVLEMLFLCTCILQNKEKKNRRRRYSLDQCICFFFLLYLLGKIILFSLGIFRKELLDMGLYTELLVFLILYLFMEVPKKVDLFTKRILVLGGALGSVFIFLSCIQGVEGSFFTEILTGTKEGTVSYLVLVTLLSITNWILEEENGKWSYVVLFLSGFQMFLLLLQQSHIANWLIVFCLLAIASFFRPRASLIKKTGILLFLFLFLWSNMSLVLSYTQWFRTEAVYSLEASVYMELCLALGGLLFFHFWDRLPEGADLHKISMVRMQYYFRMVLSIAVLLFVLFLVGGEMWDQFPGEGMNGFIKTLALPVSSELITGESMLFQWMRKLGILPVLCMLICFYQLGVRFYKKCGADKEKENCFFLYYLVFIAEILLWELPCNVLFLFGILISIGNQNNKK